MEAIVPMECAAAENPNVIQNNTICIRSFVSIDEARNTKAAEKT